MMKYGKGWFNESYRHSLAARHIRTSKVAKALPGKYPTGRFPPAQMKFLRPSALQTTMVKNPVEFAKWVSVTDQNLNQLISRAKFDPNPDIEEDLLQLKKDIETFRFDYKDTYGRLAKRIELAEDRRKEYYKVMKPEERSALFFLLTNEKKVNVTPSEIEDVLRRLPELKAKALIKPVTPEAIKAVVGQKEKEIKPVAVSEAQAVSAVSDRSRLLEEIRKSLWVSDHYPPSSREAKVEAKAMALAYIRLYGELPEDIKRKV